MSVKLLESNNKISYQELYKELCSIYSSDYVISGKTAGVYYVIIPDQGSYKVFIKDNEILFIDLDDPGYNLAMKFNSLADMKRSIKSRKY